MITVTLELDTYERIKRALGAASRFIEGFVGDEAQEMPVDKLLYSIREIRRELRG